MPLEVPQATLDSRRASDDARQDARHPDLGGGGGWWLVVGRSVGRLAHPQRFCKKRKKEKKMDVETSSTPWNRRHTHTHTQKMMSVRMS